MRVLVSGYYGFDNTGDEAILEAIVQQLKARNHTPVILSKTPRDTAGAYGVEALPRMSPLALFGAVRGSDVLLSGGGGLLQDVTSSRTLSYYLGVLQLAQFLRKPTVVFNQSIGPLSSEGRSKVARVLARVRRTIVRDQGSLTLLEGMGIQATLGGDPALLLKTPEKTLDGSAPPSAAPGGKAERRKREDLERELVILAPRGGQRLATDRLGEVAHALESEGKRVMVLALQKHEDLPECRRIAAACARAEVVTVSRPSDALAHIAGARLVIGVRLHALILAAAARVPFYGVSYDPKVAGFCDDAGAYWSGIDFEVNDMISRGLRMDDPNWTRISAMRARARDSFDWALEGLG